LVAEAQVNRRDADRMRGSPFAVRRSLENQAAFVKEIKTKGLNPEHHKLLLDSGDAEADIEEFKQLLTDAPIENIGRSAVEWLSDIASTRRRAC
jgi:hypothetical protein